MSYTGIGQLSAGPKTPLSVKRARGTDRADRDEGKIQVSQLSEVPPPPDHFDDNQRATWEVICKELIQLGLLHEVSVEILQAYCLEVKLYFDANAVIKKEGFLITEINSKGETVTKRHPAVDVANIAFTKFMNIAGHFGFTPAAATRIKAPGKQEIKDEEFGF